MQIKEQFLINEICSYIKKVREITNMKLSKVLNILNIPKRTYYNWKSSNIIQKVSTKHPLSATKEEIEKVKEYAKIHLNVGFKKLTYIMIDEDIVYLSPWQVYMILKENKLIHRKYLNRNEANKEYKDKPTAPNEHWHTDICYVKILGVFYFLVIMLDGFSRYLLHWKLMRDMTAQSIALFTQEALDKYPDANPKIIHDNGTQYVSREFKEVIVQNNLIDVRTKVRHPETNGKAERFIGLIKHEAIYPTTPSTYQEAERVIARYEDFYNNKRLHSAIEYMRPKDWFFGNIEKVREERNRKLEEAKIKRIERNREYNNMLVVRKKV